MGERFDALRKQSLTNNAKRHAQKQKRSEDMGAMAFPNGESIDEGSRNLHRSDKASG